MLKGPVTQPVVQLEVQNGSGRLDREGVRQGFGGKRDRSIWLLAVHRIDVADWAALRCCSQHTLPRHSIDIRLLYEKSVGLLSGSMHKRVALAVAMPCSGGSSCCGISRWLLQCLLERIWHMTKIFTWTSLNGRLARWWSSLVFNRLVEEEFLEADFPWKHSPCKHSTWWSK